MWQTISPSCETQIRFGVAREIPLSNGKCDRTLTFAKYTFRIMIIFRHNFDIQLILIEFYESWIALAPIKIVSCPLFIKWQQRCVLQTKTSIGCL